MNVNQISIKINQTTLMNEGNTKLNIKDHSTSMINFNQIFSLFSLLGQSPNQTEQQAIPSTLEDQNKINEELQSFNKDDWSNLDSMLTAFLDGVQQAAYSSNLSNQVTSSGTPESNPQNLENSDQKDIDTYNWQEISSVLTALLAGIQQLQDTKMAVPNVEQSLPVDSKNPSVVSNLRDLLTTDNQIENQPFSSELVSKLGNLFMVGTGSENLPISSKLVSSGTSISKPAELILKLEKLLGKVHLQAVGQSDFELTRHTNNDLGSSVDSEINQTDIQQYGVNKPYLQSALPSQDLNPTDQGLMAGKQVQQTSFDLSNEIISKIQTILSYINPAGSENSNLKQPTDTNNVVNSQTNNLSLDKNQLLLSYIPKQGNNNVSKVPVLPLKKSTLPPDDFIAKLQHLLQKPNGIMETKLQIEQPAEVSVSEIVPEVAEWIGKSIGNLDGQFKSAETKFSLFPEHLGHIEVKITSLQGQITAQIVTDTSSAKEALEGQLQHLKQAIQQHGIVVQKLDIVQQLPSTAESSLGNLSFSQGGSGSGEQRALYFDRESGKKQTNQDSIEMENESLPASYGGMLKPSSTIDFSA